MTDEIRKFIAEGRSRKATDIHICADTPIMFRIDGKLRRATQQPLTPEMARKLCYALLTDAQIETFERTGDLDLMLAEGEGRHRINIARNNGNVGAVIRLLPERPWHLDALKLPETVRELTGRSKGLVLLTGSTGQGKTTTMAAMIDEINRTQRKHIITIEDPIETVHDNKHSLVRQREVGKDTESFNKGLRAALRQDPDVIAIGEMRDYETIRIALTAAETGVLVMSTLHVISIDKIIERLLSYVPPEEEGHIRNLMADCLQGIIHQELLPTVDRDKRVACEILTTSAAVRNIIRRRGTYLLRSIIQTGAKQGMVAMSQSIGALLSEGVISPDVAESVLYNYAT
ncbi:MAG: PilT/PilU family type 4a pilus ATPase [Planctomycetes bacterium]|nr:PilT/PilU family type 4a pilus ATPase [Planctomycetota bacterium]